MRLNALALLALLAVPAVVEKHLQAKLQLIREAKGVRYLLARRSLCLEGTQSNYANSPWPP